MGLIFLNINMTKNEKEEKIVKKIQQIAGIEPHIYEDKNIEEIDLEEYHKIKKILILSSSYDYFLIEEEGRLNHLFQEANSYSSKLFTPEIIHTESSERCLKILSENNIDLIIVFNKTKDLDIFELTKKIKQKSKTQVVVLENNVASLEKIKLRDEKNLIDGFFTWNGDGKIILSIVNRNEDLKNIREPDNKDIFRCILLIEDSIQHYSNYLISIYDEIYSYLNHIITEDLTDEQKLVRYKRKPFVFQTNYFKEGKSFFQKYKKNIIAIITDNYESGYGGQEGLKLAKKINKEVDIPILIQSSEPIKKQKNLGRNIDFISKQSPDIIKKIRLFIKKHLGSGKIIIKNQKEPGYEEIKNIKDLENFLLSSKDETLLNLSKKYIFSEWLKNLGEYELSDQFYNIEGNSNKKDIKKELLDVLEGYRYSNNQNMISDFTHTSDSNLTKFIRIGKGALGGKARGLAFISKMVRKYLSEKLFPDLNITVPRSIVLSTDVFDSFLQNNDLVNKELLDLSDERIASKFLKSDLPPTILGDLRSFIRKTRKPLIIRSSGMLEDSLLQPFAGIYASMLLPNESWEADLRFQEVCNAIKYVYASTYFEKARNYVKSTSKNISDEKMAVLIQEVVGTRHGTFFYPEVSGVAKSYNYYPSGPCKPEEGIAYLALGLGKSIVDGDSSFCFVPSRPNIPLFGTPKDFMKYSQTRFYALNLQSIYRIVNKNEETSLAKLKLDVAKKHNVLERIASTYSPTDDRIYPGLSEEGYPVLDFNPVIGYNESSLSKALTLLLEICEIELGYPVEIEFAVNLKNEERKNSELVVLQIRNMLPPDKKFEVTIDDFNSKNVLCYSENALGHNIYKDIKDIVFVKPETFDMTSSLRVVNQIKKINKKLIEKERPYLLVGPGRWGSSDHFLGIPVVWSDISGAKAIIETPYKERAIEFSQGSHFFHDMISANVSYMMTKEKKGNIDWGWLNSLKTVEDMKDIKHVKTKKPVTVKVDGKTGKAIIKIQNNGKSIQKEKED